MRRKAGRCPEGFIAQVPPCWFCGWDAVTTDPGARCLSDIALGRLTGRLIRLSKAV